MHSTKTLFIACVVVAVVAAGIVLIVWKGGGSNDESTPTPTDYVYATYTPAATPQLYTVRLTASGVQPSTTTIRTGDSVEFVNDTGVAFWPASDTYPTNDICPGFDALRSLGQGETYTITFTEARTCPFHNNVDASNASEHGTIIVQ
ncbi:MAG TPA: hypothetical protein VMJ72_01630 [Candidatus Paceibacterota bacterium]|nr:hypothetical protein [Candidatus Paceibacterota bacterium]